MKDRFERFVSQNREAFDNEIPDERVWRKIRKSLMASSGSTMTNFFWKAAAIVFFGLSSFLLIQKYQTGRNEKMDVAQVKSDFTKVEDYYIGLISNKVQELDNLPGKINSDYQIDLGNLDAMYQVLKTELEKDPSKEVVDALILNLISRIEILNREVEKMNENEEVKPAGPET